MILRGPLALFFVGLSALVHARDAPLPPALTVGQQLPLPVNPCSVLTCPPGTSCALVRDDCLPLPLIPCTPKPKCRPVPPIQPPDREDDPLTLQTAGGPASFRPTMPPKRNSLLAAIPTLTDILTGGRTQKPPPNHIRVLVKGLSTPHIVQKPYLGVEKFNTPHPNSITSSRLEARDDPLVFFSTREIDNRLSKRRSNLIEDDLITSMIKKIKNVQPFLKLRGPGVPEKKPNRKIDINFPDERVSLKSSKAPQLGVPTVFELHQWRLRLQEQRRREEIEAKLKLLEAEKQRLEAGMQKSGSDLPHGLTVLDVKEVKAKDYGLEYREAVKLLDDRPGEKNNKLVIVEYDGFKPKIEMKPKAAERVMLNDIVERSQSSPQNQFKKEQMSFFDEARLKDVLQQIKVSDLLPYFPNDGSYNSASPSGGQQNRRIDSEFPHFPTARQEKSWSPTFHHSSPTGWSPTGQPVRVAPPTFGNTWAGSDTMPTEWRHSQPSVSANSMPVDWSNGGNLPESSSRSDFVEGVLIPENYRMAGLNRDISPLHTISLGTDGDKWDFVGGAGAPPTLASGGGEGGAAGENDLSTRERTSRHHISLDEFAEIRRIVGDGGEK